MSIDFLEFGDLQDFFTDPIGSDSIQKPEVKFPMLTKEIQRSLLGSVGYWDVNNLAIGQVDEEYSRGILVERGEDEHRAIVVARYGKLHRFTISGNATYGYEAVYTDTCEDDEVYRFGESTLTPFVYKRREAEELSTISGQGAYFAALERCGYEALQPSRQHWHAGWLRSVVGHS